MSFFVRESKPAQEAPDGIGMRPHVCCIMQGGGEFRHRNVAVLFNDFDEKRLICGKFAFPPGTTLWCGPSAPSPPDRKAPSCPGRRR